MIRAARQDQLPQSIMSRVEIMDRMARIARWPKQ